MKYYETMLKMGCFSRGELAKVLNLCDATVASILYQYKNKGYIERVRHNLYVAISLEHQQPVLSRYGIGSCLFEDACISHHSALEVHGYANQVYYEVYVMTENRFKDFEYNGVRYIRVPPSGVVQTERVQSVRVTGIEQTVIDSINYLDRMGGLEELLRCLSLIPSLREKELLMALAVYNNGFLYQKTGFILEHFKDSLSLPSTFFEVCKHKIPKSDRYLTKFHGNYVYYSKWRLMGPKDLLSIINKGVEFDAL